VLLSCLQNKETAGVIDDKDSFLLTEPTSNQRQLSKNRPIVPWLRRTEYISSEVSKTTGNKNQGIETKMGVSITKDKSLSKLLDRSIQGQISAIQHTFEYVNDYEKMQNLQHPIHKHLKVAEVFPVYPDWELWGNEYTHAVFDTNPLNDVIPFKLMTGDGADSVGRSIVAATSGPSESEAEFCRVLHTRQGHSRDIETETKDED
jgi:hypothetical protein